MPNTNSTYQVKVGENEFLLSTAEINDVDLVQKSNNEFHLIHQHQSINIVVNQVNVASKNVLLQIDGVAFDVSIKDSLDMLLHTMGFSAANTKQIKQIKAPMPGMVIEVVAQVGQTIHEGDKLLILEAMKMENSIMSPTNAVIKNVLVKAGMPVDKGAILIELE